MMFPFYPRQVLTGPLGYALSWGRFVYAALLIDEYAGCRSCGPDRHGIINFRR